jgi:hypothetical protein
MAVDALDKYYLALTVLVTIGYQLLGFAIAWTFQFDKITDFTGGKHRLVIELARINQFGFHTKSLTIGSNFFLLAILTLCVNGIYHARNIVATVFVLVWATRLAGASSRRHFLPTHLWSFRLFALQGTQDRLRYSF